MDLRLIGAISIVAIAILAAIGALVWHRWARWWFYQPAPIEPIDVFFPFAVDTPSKLASSVRHLRPWSADHMFPGVAMDQGDRQHSVWIYSGVLAGAPVAPASTGYSYWGLITLVQHQNQ